MKLFFTILGCVVGLVCNAQVTTTTNVIYGYVGDYSTNPQPAVVMTTKLLAPNPKWVNNIRVLVNPISVTTDVNGYYAFTNQQWGLYQLFDPNGPVGLYFVYTNTTGVVPIYTLFTNVPVALPANPNNTPISLGQVLALLATGVNATNFVYTNVTVTNYLTVTNLAYTSQTNYPLVTLTNDNNYVLLIPLKTNIVNGVTNYTVEITLTNQVVTNTATGITLNGNPPPNNNATIGAYAMSIGAGCLASNAEDFAGGNSCIAQGGSTFAFGNSVVNYGASSFAAGINNTINAGANFSTVFGANATANAVETFVASDGTSINNSSAHSWLSWFAGGYVLGGGSITGNGGGITNLNANNPTMMAGALTTNLTSAILSTRTMYFTNGILIKIQ